MVSMMMKTSWGAAEAEVIARTDISAREAVRLLAGMGHVLGRGELQAVAEKACTVEVADGVRCEMPVYARGMCSVHYFRDRRYGDPLGGADPDICIVYRCGGIRFENGFCREHAQRPRKDKEMQ